MEYQCKYSSEERSIQIGKEEGTEKKKSYTYTQCFSKQLTKFMGGECVGHDYFAIYSCVQNRQDWGISQKQRKKTHFNKRRKQLMALSSELFEWRGFFVLLFYSGLGPKKNTIHSELVLVCICFAFGLQNDAEVHVFLWIHLKTSNASVYAMPWFMNILVRWCRRSFLSNILPEEWFNLWRKNRRRLAFNLCRSLRLKTVSIFILATYNTYRSNDFGV